MQRVAPPSRGALRDGHARCSGAPVEEGLDHLREVGANYQGFNLIFSMASRLGLYESVLRRVASWAGIRACRITCSTRLAQGSNAKNRLQAALSDVTTPALARAIAR